MKFAVHQTCGWRLGVDKWTLIAPSNTWMGFNGKSCLLRARDEHNRSTFGRLSNFYHVNVTIGITARHIHQTPLSTIIRKSTIANGVCLWMHFEIRCIGQSFSKMAFIHGYSAKRSTQKTLPNHISIDNPFLNLQRIMQPINTHKRPRLENLPWHAGWWGDCRVRVNSVAQMRVGTERKGQ